MGEHAKGEPGSPFVASGSQQEKFDALERLARGAVHELNNVLQVIQGNAKVALRGKHDSEELMDIIEQIDGAAHRATALGERLLLASGRARLDCETVDLVALISARCEQLGVEFDRDPGAANELPAGDSRLIAIAVDALLQNAIEAAPTRRPRAMVQTVSPRELDRWWCPIECDRSESPLRVLQVEDDGEGIAADVRSRVFEPYFSTRTGHAGLGLSMALGVAQLHGGGVWLPAEDRAERSVVRLGLRSVPKHRRPPTVP